MRQQVRQPGDGVRLATAGGVLDEVVVTDPLLNDFRLQFANHVKLMVARENQYRLLFIFHRAQVGVENFCCDLLLVDEVID